MKTIYYVNDKIDFSGFLVERVQEDDPHVVYTRNGSPRYNQAYVTVENGEISEIRDVTSADVLRFYDYAIEDLREEVQIVDYPDVLRRVKEEPSQYVVQYYEEQFESPAQYFIADKDIQKLLTERLPFAQVVSEETVARVDRILSTKDYLTIPTGSYDNLSRIILGERQMYYVKEPFSVAGTIDNPLNIDLELVADKDATVARFEGAVLTFEGDRLLEIKQVRAEPITISFGENGAKILARGSYGLALDFKVDANIGELSHMLMQQAKPITLEVADALYDEQALQQRISFGNHDISCETENSDGVKDNLQSLIDDRARLVRLHLHTPELQDLTGRSAFEDSAIQYQEPFMEESMEFEMG